MESGRVIKHVESTSDLKGKVRLSLSPTVMSPKGSHRERAQSSGLDGKGKKSPDADECTPTDEGTPTLSPCLRSQEHPSGLGAEHALDGGRHNSANVLDVTRPNAGNAAELVVNACPKCKQPIEEFEEETIALCMICLSAFVQRTPTLAAPLLLDLLQAVAEYAYFTFSFTSHFILLI